MASKMKLMKSFYRTLKVVATREKKLQKELLNELRNDRKFEKLFINTDLAKLDRPTSAGSTRNQDKS